MKLVARVGFISAVLVFCSAHVGTHDAWFDGRAGAYRVLVHVDAPDVIPGIAVVNVRVRDSGVRGVSATANRFDATGGAPPAELARPVAETAGLYRTKLWIMTSGSYSITVFVDGERGKGSVLVPLTASPSRQRAFTPPLAALLAGVGLFLFAGALTIVGAAVREGVLAPGEQAGADRRRAARRAMLRAGVAISLVLFGLWRWWIAEDAAFRRTIFRPLESAARAENHELVLEIRDSSWIMRGNEGWIRVNRATRHAPLIADHGKVMHMFVVDESGGRVFAHLHPTTGDSIVFRASLPPLPAGRYTVFGDIVHQTGFAQTLTTRLEIPIMPGGTSAPPAAVLPGDPDDSYAIDTVARGAPNTVLPDGSVMTWIRPDDAIVAGEGTTLRFEISAPAGSPPLEPYMGMPAHAAVVRDDARVFVHLHPFGTISMAAQAQFSGVGEAPVHAGTHVASVPAKLAGTDTVSFPFAFPEAGSYHLWVQVKRAGKVLTGVFAATVLAGTSPAVTRP